MKITLKENEDYYLLPDGKLVFSAAYLLKRKVCCGNGCFHCPYEYMNVKEPYKSNLLQQRKKLNEQRKEA